MKTNKLIKTRYNGSVVFVTAAIAAAPVTVITIPAIILDILMAVNLILTLLVFLLLVFFSGGQHRIKSTEEKLMFSETAIFSFIPIVSLLCSVFGLAVYVASTRLILAKGTEVDSKILLFVSGLIRMGGIAGIIAGFIIVCVMVSVIKRSTRLSETAARFILDIMPAIMTAAERTYTCGEISEETFIARKDHLTKQTDFFGATDGAGKFIAGNVKVAIFIMAVSFLGGIIIGTILQGQAIKDAVETSIVFSAGSGIIFFLPLLLLSAGLSIVSIRMAGFSFQHTTDTRGMEKI
jgi:flagellar biosynthesis protein FlhA